MIKAAESRGGRGGAGNLYFVTSDCMLFEGLFISEVCFACFNYIFCTMHYYKSDLIIRDVTKRDDRSWWVISQHF